MCILNQYFELYKAVRSHIEFEYNQIGNRLNWLISSQAFLFVALVINLSSTVSLSSPDIVDIPIKPRYTIPQIALWNDAFGAVDIIHKWSLFYPILPILGLLISIFVLIGSWAAILRITDLKMGEAHFREKLNIGEYKYAIRSKNTFAHYIGLISIIFIPISFIVIWYFIINPDYFKFFNDKNAAITIICLILLNGFLLLHLVAYFEKGKIYTSCTSLNIIISVTYIILYSTLYFDIIKNMDCKELDIYSIPFLPLILPLILFALTKFFGGAEFEVKKPGSGTAPNGTAPNGTAPNGTAPNGTATSPQTAG